jgi:Flp pilus assembly protein TadG
MVILKKEMNMNSNIVGNVNVDGDKIFYSPDTNNLNSTPSCDIFGYLMASAGVTNNTSEEDVVEKLYELKRMSTTYSPYISTILSNIIGYGDIDDYMEVLTETSLKFITSWGEVVDVKDLSWI